MGNINKVELKIPNLGEAEDTEIIEIATKIGQEVNLNDPLIVLESEKAAMEVPSDFNGKIIDLKVKEGDMVKEGMVFAIIETKESQPTQAAEKEKDFDESQFQSSETVPKKNENNQAYNYEGVNAGPAVRKIARELEINLNAIKGTGKNLLITKEDLKNYVHNLGKASLDLYADEEKLREHGPYKIEEQSKIRKIGAKNLYNSWSSIPHVSHIEEADITNAETSRKALNESSDKKISPVSYITKAVVDTLKEFPIMNSSIIGEGRVMIKEYINIGIAVDTDQGLLVPVLKNADKLDVLEIADRIKTLSEKAKNKKLKSNELQGATFTISSLGQIGGHAFTPIINPPEVGIIGVSRAKKTLALNDGEISESTILPMTLSYDHRVINGADAGNFMWHLKKVLEQIKL